MRMIFLCTVRQTDFFVVGRRPRRELSLITKQNSPTGHLRKPFVWCAKGSSREPSLFFLFIPSLHRSTEGVPVGDLHAPRTRRTRSKLLSLTVRCWTFDCICKNGDSHAAPTSFGSALAALGSTSQRRRVPHAVSYTHLTLPTILLV